MAAAATTASLPEDVIREILLRVDLPAAVFRCAVTCKGWSRLVADASLLRRDQDPCGSSSTCLAGLFTWKRHKPFVPTPRSFGLGRRCLNSLFTDSLLTDGTGIRYGPVPLISRQGLLLVLFGEHDSIIQLAVYNLLTGVRDVLPPLYWDDCYFESSGYAILTGKDYSSNRQHQSFSPPSPGNSAFFKVLIMGVDRYDRPRNLYTFSSGDAAWSEPRELLVDTVFYDYEPPALRHPDAVVCRGVVHWIVGNWTNVYSKLYILNLDMKTCRISFTKIVAPANKFCSLTYSEPLLSVSANRMLTVLFQPRPGLRVHICTRQHDIKSEDGTTAGWLCTQVVELKPPQTIEERPMHLSLLGEKTGTLLLKSSKRDLYTADLETGLMEEVTSWFPRLNRWDVVLLETDWAAFFISRFGGQ